MANPHFDRQPISRAKGQSILAKAAYNSCSQLADKDYRKKSGLAYEQLLTADSQPMNRLDFWQAVDQAEKRKDAQLGYSYTIGLPIELTKDQQITLAQDFSHLILDRYGFAAVDMAIHHPTKRKKSANTEKENPHIHLLTSTRTRDGKKLRLFGKTDDLLDIRKLWEETCNRHLERAGSTARISVDTIENQITKTEDQLQTVETEITTLKTEIGELENERREIENLNTRRNINSHRPADERNPETRIQNQPDEQRNDDRSTENRPAAGSADNRRTGTRREHSATGSAGAATQPRRENNETRIEFEKVEEKLRTLIKMQDLKTLHPSPITEAFKKIAQKLREYIKLTDEIQLKRIIENANQSRDTQKNPAPPHP